MIATLLLVAAAASASLTGLALSILVAGPVAMLDAVGLLPQPTTVALTLVGVALALDIVGLVTGRVQPITYGRQVPREWSALLDPRIVAVLYGARLGVGPLTILSTWVWWAAVLGAAVLGPGPSIAVGLTFGVVRMTVNLVVSLLAEQRDRPAFFRLLQTRRRPGWAGLTGLGLVALALTVAGCSSGEETAGPGSAPAPTFDGADGADADAEDGRAASDLEAPLPTEVVEPSPHRSLNTPIDDGRSPAVTVPARLEDVVRQPDATRTRPNERPADRPEPEELAAALPGRLRGFEQIAEPSADRYLDLDAASQIQPDPTEEISLLETRGYQGGWLRAFRNETNDVAVASVYQFASADEAEFYLEDGLIMIGGYGGSFFDIEERPGVRGFSQRITDDGDELLTLGASFQEGPRWYLLYLLGSPESVTPDALVGAIDEMRET